MEEQNLTQHLLSGSRIIVPYDTRVSYDPQDPSEINIWQKMPLVTGINLNDLRKLKVLSPKDTQPWIVQFMALLSTLHNTLLSTLHALTHDETCLVLSIFNSSSITLS